MAGEEGPEKDLWTSRCLRPCTGRHMRAEEEEVAVGKSVCGGPARPINSSRGLAAKKKKDAVIGEKRKAEAERVTTAVSSEVGKAAAGAVDSSVGDLQDQASKIKWVEMPTDYIKWLLAQKREDYRVRTLEDYSIHRSGNDPTELPLLYTQEELDEERKLILEVNASMEAGNEEFFEFQAWVRETFDRNGRVMVPEDFKRPQSRRYAGLAS